MLYGSPMTADDIKAARLKLKLTQRELAEKLGFCKTGNVYISAIEHGRRKLSITAQNLIQALLNKGTSHNESIE